MLRIRPSHQATGAVGCDRDAAEEDWRYDCSPIYPLATGGGSAGLELAKRRLSLNLERKRLGIDFLEQMGYSSIVTMPPQSMKPSVCVQIDINPAAVP
jgi:hypothetical protein